MFMVFISSVVITSQHYKYRCHVIGSLRFSFFWATNQKCHTAYTPHWKCTSLYYAYTVCIDFKQNIDRQFYINIFTIKSRIIKFYSNDRTRIEADISDKHGLLFFWIFVKQIKFSQTRDYTNFYWDQIYDIAHLSFRAQWNKSYAPSKILK